MSVNHSKRGLLVVGLITSSILAGMGCQQAIVAEKASAAAAPMDRAAMVKRGEYLVTIAVCNDCHTPWKMGSNGPEPDMSRMLSGHPETVQMPASPKLSPEWGWAGATMMTSFVGPWGISYAANLTPDRNTGLGIWDEAMFVKTIRNGRHMGEGRPLNPPMPWPWFAKMTDEDLKAVFAYLRSIPPIVNHVPEYQEPAGAP